MDTIASRRSIGPCFVFLGMTLFVAVTASAQVAFTDVSEEFRVEIGGLNYGVRSVAFGDFNNDSRPDVCFVEGGGGRYFLLYNEGNGRFIDRSVAMQSPAGDKSKGSGMIFGDYDNDGDLDLFVPVRHLPWTEGYGGRNALLRNDQGMFVDVMQEAGFVDSMATDNAIWLDYDRDGDLDLYVGNQTIRDVAV